MKIEIWSDYACPYCYIGKVRLEKAIKKLGYENHINIVMRSFELDTNASREVVSTTLDRFSKKYGLTKEMGKQRIDSITKMAVEEGIDFKYISTRYTNTFDAHRLTKLAESKGKQEIVEKLFQAYFTENLELSNVDVLVDVGVQVGLDKDEIMQMLSSDAFVKEVREDELEANKQGIHGVPYILVNNTYTISGAQTVHMLYHALKEVLEKEDSTSYSLDAMLCDKNGCNIGGKSCD